MALSIPKEKVLKDRKTGKTFEELLYLKELLLQKRFDCIYILSNKYHIPRVRTMIMYAPKLASLKKQFEIKKISLISAESILLLANRRLWKNELDNGYKSVWMKERIRMEKSGIKQIKNGTYNGI